MDEIIAKIEEMNATLGAWKADPEAYNVDLRHIWVLEDSIDSIQGRVEDLQYEIIQASSFEKIDSIAQTLSK